MLMKKLYPIILLSKTRQHGWIMLEVVLCLALFSVVLHLAQRQNEAHWRSTQQLEEQRKNHENQQKQAAMEALTGSAAWLNNQESSLNQAYPDCQKCSENQLKRWFYASQHDLSNIDVEGE
ncbi:MAG: type II secretory pathway component PulJ [Marinomonas primoryensis]|jgi:type II secretory pathway component PulJ|tara:strand:+ start:133300 stop:133662 length:363 start_codon:yes stop_codon:yes gene_type:complete